MKISRFHVVNADTRKDIRPLLNNDILFLGDLPPRINIRAETDPAMVGRVEFVWSDGTTQVERNPPYSARAKRDIPRGEPGFLGPDGQNRTYIGWTPSPGLYQFTAVLFPTVQGGQQEASLSRSFIVSPGKASDILTVDQAAAMLGVHQDSLFRVLIADATIPIEVIVNVRREDAVRNREKLIKKP